MTNVLMFKQINYHKYDNSAPYSVQQQNPNEFQGLKFMWASYYSCGLHAPVCVAANFSHRMNSQRNPHTEAHAMYCAFKILHTSARGKSAEA
jgi:hypothetical protein